RSGETTLRVLDEPGSGTCHLLLEVLRVIVELHARRKKKRGDLSVRRLLHCVQATRAGESIRPFAASLPDGQQDGVRSHVDFPAMRTGGTNRCYASGIGCGGGGLETAVRPNRAPALGHAFCTTRAPRSPPAEPLSRVRPATAPSP